MVQAAFTRLPGRAWVRIAGPDSPSFLQGLLTQDVETLQRGELRYAALLSPQGKLLFDLFILGGEDGVLVDVEADRRDDFIQRLTLYRLRAKVVIEPVEDGVFVLWGTPSAPPPWAPDPRLPQLGFRAIGATRPEDAEELDEDAYDAHRLALGVSDPAKDSPEGGDYPIEANLDLLGAIDFKKGCFVGQETTSRMKRRGIVRNRLLPIRFEGAPPAKGSEVLADSALRAGEVRSGREGAALALLRLDRIEQVQLTVDGRLVRVETPDWFAQRLAP